MKKAFAYFLESFVTSMAVVQFFLIDSLSPKNYWTDFSILLLRYLDRVMDMASVWNIRQVGSIQTLVVGIGLGFFLLFSITATFSMWFDARFPKNTSTLT